MSGARQELRRALRRVAVDVLVVVTVLAACAAWLYNNHEPGVHDSTVASRVDVIGGWHMKGDSTARIRFDSDGQFVATSVPSDMLHFHQLGETSTTGTWKLDPAGRYVRILMAGSASDAAANPDAGVLLSVVESDNVQYLCVSLGAQMVKCDYLLERIPG